MIRRLRCVGGLLLLLVWSMACSPRTARQSQAPEESTSPVTNAAARAPIGGTYCVQTLTQGQALSASVHFSNKESQSDGSMKDFESDLAGNKLDVTIHERHPATDFDREVNNMKGIAPTPIHDGYAESVRTNHYSRADAAEWTMGANSVVMSVAPWGLFLSKPVINQEGAEKINDYDTIKYSVDTTHQNAMDKSALMIAERLKDYNIVGTLWVLRDRDCILQYSIDYEEDDQSGKVSKTHYEGGITKP